MSPYVTLDYGGRYSAYGYIEENGLFSPRAAETVTPSPGYRIRVAGTQETVAPGAEEFLPPVATGLWLSPEGISFKETHRCFRHSAHRADASRDWWRPEAGR